jgi:hypothetical protein
MSGDCCEERRWVSMWMRGVLHASLDMPAHPFQPDSPPPSSTFVEVVVNLKGHTRSACACCEHCQVVVAASTCEQCRATRDFSVQCTHTSHIRASNDVESGAVVFAAAVGPPFVMRYN